MLENAWLIPLTMAASFVVILFFGKRMPKKGAEIGILAIGACFLMSVIAAFEWIAREGHPEREAVERHLTWFKFGNIDLGAGIHVDGLTVMMLFVVTFISLMVHVYSTGYMHGDRRYTYFFAALSLFTAAMLLLVVADNTLQMLIGWELVGLCSFMLIGHWWEETDNSSAAIKAFITTRIGDVGLLTGHHRPLLRRRPELQHRAPEPRGPHRRHQPHPAASSAPASCSSGSWARAPSSRCTSGSPTPWPAPRRCRP